VATTPAPETGYGRGRVEAISDGVVAVAMTLLALGIKAPQVAPGETLWQAFDIHTLGQIGLFLLSFFMIARFWLMHHRLFRELPDVLSPRFVVLNFAFLAALCLMPFATTTYSENSNDLTALAIYTRTLSQLFLPVTIVLLAIPVGYFVGPSYALFVWASLFVVGGGRLERMRQHR
jgi:uncharacterized membrane protein